MTDTYQRRRMRTMRAYVVVSEDAIIEAGMIGPETVSAIVAWATHPRTAAVRSGITGRVIVFQVAKAQLHGYTYEVEADKAIRVHDYYPPRGGGLSC